MSIIFIFFLLIATFCGSARSSEKMAEIGALELINHQYGSYFLESEKIHTAGCDENSENYLFNGFSIVNYPLWESFMDMSRPFNQNELKLILHRYQLARMCPEFFDEASS